METKRNENGCKTSTECVTKLFKIIGMVIIGLCFAVIFALAFGFLAKWLWNYLMPDLFGLSKITYFQAFAMVVLAKLLFGAFGSHIPKHSHMHRPPFIKLHEPFHCHIPGHLKNEPDDSECFRMFWHEEGKEAFEKYKEKSTGGRDDGR
jgi:hypothetical protein